MANDIGNPRHKFSVVYFSAQVSVCSYCKESIWNFLSIYSYKCDECGYIVHKKCMDAALYNSTCPRKEDLQMEVIKSADDIYSDESSVVPENNKEVTMEGWLWKKGQLKGNQRYNKNTTRWLHRFFELKRNNLHYYLVEPNIEGRHILKNFNMKYDDTTPEKLGYTNEIGYVLQLDFDGGQVLRCASPTCSEFAQWISVFNEILDQPIEKAKNLEKSGWLLLDYGNGKWQMRYFSLSDLTISWKVSVEKGFFYLPNSTVKVEENDEIVIISPTASIQLRADPEDHSKWLNAIHASINNLKRKSSVSHKNNSPHSGQDRDALELLDGVVSILDEERERTSSTAKKTNNMDLKSKRFRILSFDGGGIRGILTVIILQRLIKVFPDLMDRVDLITGTSNGGIVAMGLAFGHTPEFIRSLLEISGKYVFSKKTRGYTASISCAKFTNTYLKMICDTIWGDLKLSDAKKLVLIPAFALDNDSCGETVRSVAIKYFHNYKSKSNDNSEERHEALSEQKKLEHIASSENSSETLSGTQKIENSLEEVDAVITVPNVSEMNSQIQQVDPLGVCFVEETAKSFKSEAVNKKENEKFDHLQHERSGSSESKNNLSAVAHQKTELETEVVAGNDENDGCSSYNRNTCDGGAFSSGENELASDIVMRSSAAPTFFPSWQSYIDGGMFAQDPSSAALMLAISPTKVNKKSEDICLLSIGTGIVNRFYEDTSSVPHDWGYVQWLPKLAYVLWDGMVLTSEAMCKEYLGERYFRVNPNLDSEIPLDDHLQLPTLVSVAQTVNLDDTVEWIRKMFYDDGAKDTGKSTGKETTLPTN